MGIESRVWNSRYLDDDYAQSAHNLGLGPQCQTRLGLHGTSEEISCGWMTDLRERTGTRRMQWNVAARDVLDVFAASLCGHFAQTIRNPEIAADLLVGTEQSLQRFFPTVGVDSQAGQDIRNG